MSADIYFQNEQQTWEKFRVKSAYKTRAKIRKEFQSLFPCGHKTSLKSFVASMSNKTAFADFANSEEGKFLRDVHPDAFQIIAKYGISYRPRCFYRPPPIEPKPYACYENAYKLMVAGNMYVEGIIAGAICDPMLHAWNVSPKRMKQAIDWTFYAGTHWTRYFGIALTKSEYTTLVRDAFPELGDNRKVTTLFHVRDFEQIYPYLEKLLRDRSQRVIK